MSNTRLQRDAAKLCKMIEAWRKYGIAEHIVAQSAKVRDAIRAEQSSAKRKGDAFAAQQQRLTSEAA